MPDLNDLLPKSLSEMSTEELQERIRQVRTSRRTVKDTEKAVKAVAKTEKKKATTHKSITSLGASLTPEEILKLLKEHGG